MVSERLLACDTLLSELRHLDYETASEAEMVGLMQSADQSSERCAELWLEQADTRGERQIAIHEGRQLPFQALLLESAISARFDNRFGYCDILDDTFALLFTGLAEIEQALSESWMSEDERNQLIELRDLDLEAVDVLVVHREENCEE